jgi:hypothetical protein
LFCIARRTADVDTAHGDDVRARVCWSLDHRLDRAGRAVDDNFNAECG